jgi:transcriptional regulator with XRE-family HTH domain
MEESGMSGGPMQTVVSRMKALRAQRGLTTQGLAEAMTRVGVPWEAGVVTKLETGRRKSVSVAELLALAYVLDVAPVHLLVPLENGGTYEITPTVTALTEEVRAWCRAQFALPGTDRRKFFSEVPEDEFSPRVLFERYGVDGEVVERVLTFEQSPEAHRMDDSPSWKRVSHSRWYIGGDNKIVVLEEGQENGGPDQGD